MTARSMATPLAVAALLLAAGCSNPPAPAPVPPTVSPAPAESEPAVAPAPTPTVDAAPAVPSREQVAGDWSTSGTDYESLSLRPDGSADSYLHDRPFDQGKWQLSGAELEIEWEANGVEKVTVVGRSGAELKVKTEGGPMVWHAIETP